MNANKRNRRAEKESRDDYQEALRASATSRAREFDRMAAAAPLWEGDGSDVWF